MSWIYREECKAKHNCHYNSYENLFQLGIITCNYKENCKYKKRRRFKGGKNDGKID